MFWHYAALSIFMIAQSLLNHGIKKQVSVYHLILLFSLDGFVPSGTLGRSCEMGMSSAMFAGPSINFT
jgi:hypothetical protein